MEDHNIGTAALAASLAIGTGAASQAATQGPCDIYAAAGTPCVAAHSSTRALFGSYNGPLYQVQRASDGGTKDIVLLAAGGYANADAQDTFCSGTTCVVTKIYDQSSRHNDLTIEAAGGMGPANSGVPAVTSVITSSSSATDRGDATWIVRPGLAKASCVSFESRNFPGDFLRHYDFKVQRQPMDGSAAFRADATFCPVIGLNGRNTSLKSYNYPSKYLRHYSNTLYVASNGGSNAWDATASFADDATFVVGAPWAP